MGNIRSDSILLLSRVHFFCNVASFSSIIGLIYFIVYTLLNNAEVIGQFITSLNSVQMSAQTNKTQLLLLLPVPVQHQLDCQTSVKNQFFASSEEKLKQQEYICGSAFDSRKSMEPFSDGSSSRRR